MQLIKAQLYGASVMGLGFALMEDVVVHDGSVLNPNLTDYVIPTIADKPEFPQVVVVEDQFPPSAFGVKGVGEIGMISTAPAITNAIYDAIGVRFRELPVTSEKVYFSLMGRGTKK
jgi:CO/xanthine dehydrogenase Mo-binding subunit